MLTATAAAGWSDHADSARGRRGTAPRPQALLLGEPEVFFTTPGHDGWPLVMLRLAEVDVDRLKELVIDAWRMRAPEHFRLRP